jgi:TRAP-type C4-dicarboxylate transport system permease small subunit
MNPIKTGLGVANQIALWIGALAILVMTVMGGLDVLSTTLLGQPVHTTVEATEILMVFVVYLGLGMVHQTRSHVAVDFVYVRLGTRGQHVLDVLVLALMFVFFAVIAWQGGLAALRSWRISEYAPGLVPLPLFPARLALAAGAGLAALNCLVELTMGRLPPASEVGGASPDVNSAL